MKNYFEMMGNYDKKRNIFKGKKLNNVGVYMKGDTNITGIDKKNEHSNTKTTSKIK